MLGSLDWSDKCNCTHQIHSSGEVHYGSVNLQFACLGGKICMLVDKDWQRNERTLYTVWGVGRGGASGIEEGLVGLRRGVASSVRGGEGLEGVGHNW